ncbi:hypothetical protein UFOVP730_36 [uncultured Caudovirales phage]|uniref:Uncharacterized protein n=1 Tax=uncultured Caudovirales phage TaxID=2100421 RepID=A0A6J5NQI6_9CAUD|nr:hypothetical protein UFOVP730_36 [uncultured Caudovirales phage]
MSDEYEGTAMMPDEPDNLINWYCSLGETDHDEVRRVVALSIAVSSEANPGQLLPMARLIEMFLAGQAEELSHCVSTVTPIHKVH